MRFFSYVTIFASLLAKVCTYTPNKSTVGVQVSFLSFIILEVTGHHLLATGHKDQYGEMSRDVKDLKSSWEYLRLSVILTYFLSTLSF